MTHAAIAATYRDGDPRLLVQITSDSGTWRYTPGNAFITAMAETWEPVAGLDIGTITLSGELAKDKLVVTFPLGHFMGQRYLGIPPEEPTTATIFDGHLSDIDGEYLMAWKGKILGGKPSGNKNALQCETLWASANKNGLNGFWLKQCEHTLYGRGCGLDHNDFAVAATCTSVASTLLTIPEAALEADGHWVGGMVKGPTGLYRWIIAHIGDKVTISTPLDSLTGTGEAITIYPGCDHTRGRCRAFFNNILAYGGNDWLPDKNPMAGSSIR